MPNVNKVTVMGVLGRDPETKQFPNGGSVTTFSVATTEFWKDKTTGERDCEQVPQERRKGLYRGQLAYKEVERQ